MVSITTNNLYYGTFYYSPCRIWSANVIKITEPYCREKKYIPAFIENDFYNPAGLFIIHCGFYSLCLLQIFLSDLC